MLNSTRFDPTLERAIVFAVGNTLVCDMLDEAKRLSWSGDRFKGKILNACFNFFWQGALHSYYHKSIYTNVLHCACSCDY